MAETVTAPTPTTPSSASTSTPAAPAASAAASDVKGSLRGASYDEGQAIVSPPLTIEYSDDNYRFAPARGEIKAPPVAPTVPDTIEYSDDNYRFAPKREQVAAEQAALAKTTPAPAAAPAATAPTAAPAAAAPTAAPTAPTAAAPTGGAGAVSGKVDGSGKSWGTGSYSGDRKADSPTVDPKTKEVKPAASSQVSVKDVASAAKGVDLKEVTKEQKTDLGGGFYHSEKSGSGATYGGSTKVSAKQGVDQISGKTTNSLSGPSAYAVAGGEEREAWGYAGEADALFGKTTLTGEAYYDVYGGADARGSISDQGLKGEAHIGAGAVAGVKGGLDYKSSGPVVDGKEVSLAGLGVHGEATVGAYAGATGGAYLTKDKVGVGGSAGAFIGAEAKGDVTANLGPIQVKGTASAMAGGGLGADGSVLYEDGKIKIGGRTFAALGYGGALGTEVTVDLNGGLALLKWATGMGVDGADEAQAKVEGDYGECDPNAPAGPAAYDPTKQMPTMD